MTHANGERPGHLGADGFTLTEVLFVVGVLGILAVVAVTVFGSAHTDVSLEEAAERLGADIEYARDRAVARGHAQVLRFSDSGRRYEIADAKGTLMHPVSRDAFQVGISELVGGHPITVSISGLPGDSLSFDTDGLPSAGGTIDIESGSSRWRVEVAKSTGRVTVGRM